VTRKKGLKKAGSSKSTVENDTDSRLNETSVQVENDFNGWVGNERRRREPEKKRSYQDQMRNCSPYHINPARQVTKKGGRRMGARRPEIQGKGEARRRGRGGGTGLG